MSKMLRPDIETASIDLAKAMSAPVDLRLTVREKVIPRLRKALEHSLDRPPHPLVVGAARDQEIAFLADLLLADQLPGALERMAALRAQGRTLGQLYLHLLAPTALHLRDLWREDICGLADVTIAFCNLQSILRHYASEFYGEACRPDTGLRALLVSQSKTGSLLDPHFFGVMLLSDFFRRDGWDAWIERSLASGNFRDTVLSGWFDLVEVVVTSDDQLDEVASGIRIIRRGSPNPSVGVIVCGEVFRANPEFVRLVGADLMATDPLSSLAQAKQFVTRPAPHRRLS